MTLNEAGNPPAPPGGQDHPGTVGRVMDLRLNLSPETGVARLGRYALGGVEVDQDPLPDPVGTAGLPDIVQQGRPDEEGGCVRPPAQEGSRHRAAVVPFPPVHRQKQPVLPGAEPPLCEGVIRHRQEGQESEERPLNSTQELAQESHDPF